MPISRDEVRSDHLDASPGAWSHSPFLPLWRRVDPLRVRNWPQPLLLLHPPCRFPFGWTAKGAGPCFCRTDSKILLKKKARAGVRGRTGERDRHRKTQVLLSKGSSGWRPISDVHFSSWVARLAVTHGVYPLQHPPGSDESLSWSRKLQDPPALLHSLATGSLSSSHLGTPSTKSWAGRGVPLLWGIQAAPSSCCRGHTSCSRPPATHVRARQAQRVSGLNLGFIDPV